MLLERRHKGGTPSHPTPQPDTPIIQKDDLHLNGQLSLLNHLTMQGLATQTLEMHVCIFAE